VEVENRRTEGLDNSNTAFSLYMLGVLEIHLNNALDTSIANANENISNKASTEEASKIADESKTSEGGLVIFKNGVSIHIAEDGFIKSIIGEAKVKTTWEIIE